MKICKPYKNCKITDITQSFSSNHTGVDFSGDYGEFLVAPENCLVYKITTPKTFDGKLEDLEKGYGIRLKSCINPNTFYLYWHCLPIFPVIENQLVFQGEVVAQMGNSGFVKSGGQVVPIESRTQKPFLGTHLHAEMLMDGVAVDILKYISWDIEINYDILTSIKNIIQKINNLLKGR